MQYNHRSNCQMDENLQCLQKMIFLEILIFDPFISISTCKTSALSATNCQNVYRDPITPLYSHRFPLAYTCTYNKDGDVHYIF